MLNQYPDILKIQEVANILRVHPSTVRRMVKRGDLKKIESFNNRYLFNKQYIINFINKGGVGEKNN